MALMNEMTALDGDRFPAPSCGAELSDAALDAEEADPEGYVLHPKATAMPALPEKTYSALKAGIEEHGLQHPIEVQKGTRYLLNGRGRYRACRELRIPLKIKEVDIPDDEVAVYTGAEAAKRGLTPSQKATIALDLLPEFERRAARRQHLGEKVHQGEKGKAAELAASLVGANARYVQLAIKLRKEQPALFERLRSGDLDLAKAIKTGGAPKRKPKSKGEERHPIPEYLRDRLIGIKEAVGRDTLGEAIEALLDYAEGSPGWTEWAEARRQEPAA
jgi:hypothetical protein